jgi:4'-phosphopantetheinyl transferase
MNHVVKFNSFIQLEASELVSFLISKEKKTEIQKCYEEQGYVIVYTKFEGENSQLVLDDEQLQILGNDKKHYDKAKNLKYKFRYFLGRALIKHTLSNCLKVSTDKIHLQYGPYGKPFFYEKSEAIEVVDFNLSHTKDIFILAVTKLGRIGIDIESSSREIDKLSIAETICVDFELQKLQSLPKNSRNPFLLQLWTLKEAFSKGLGLGLHKPFDSFGIKDELSQFQLVELEETENNSDNWFFFTKIFLEKYQLSIALEYW